MATPTAPRPRGIADLDVPLEQLVEALRKPQADPKFAEQRHQFLDIDPDLATRWADVTIHTADTDGGAS